MDPFKLTRQSVTFIALMAGVAVVVAVAAPFGSIALGAVALAATGAVLVKAGEGLRSGTVTRSVSYSDPQMQQRLKDGLRAAGIPFKVKTQDGKEFVGWDAEHAAAAQAVDEKIKEGPLPGGRNAHFSDAGLQKQFTDWLGEKGIQHEVVKSDGKDYVVWHAGAGDAVRDFTESRGSAGCKGKVAAGKPESGRC